MDNTVIHINSDEKGHVKEKLLKLLTKKNIKIFCLVFVAIVALILFLGVDSDSDTEQYISSNSKDYMTTLDYCNLLESKLTELLSNVDGAGVVKVMVNVDGSPELVYATEKDETISSNTSGTTTSNNSSTPIIVDVGSGSSALILTEKLPKVKGVIVVSGGANNVSVRLDIINAVSTLLDIDANKISVLKGI